MGKGLIIGIVVVILIIVIAAAFLLMGTSSDEIVVAAATPTPQYQQQAPAAPASNYPPGLGDGDSVGAPGIGIWRLANGGRMWYSPQAYASYGSPAYTNITVDQMNAIPSVGNVAVK